MPLSEEAWRSATQPIKADLLALGTVQAGLPESWMRMSPYELMTGAAIIALHYDRKRMAEALRDRVIFGEHAELPPQIEGMPEEILEAFKWVSGRVEATILALAEQIENGTVGLQ